METSRSATLATAPAVDVAGLEVPGLEGLDCDAEGRVALADLVAFLDGADPSSFPTDHDVLDAVAVWDRVAAAVSGRLLAAVAELASRPEVYGPDDDPTVVARRAVRAPAGTTTRTSLPDELSARLNDGQGASSNRCRAALELPTRFPLMWHELQAGRASEAKGRILVLGCQALDDAAARVVDERVAHLADRQAPSRFRQSVRRAVLRVDPDDAAIRRERAEKDRCVRISPAEDGMAELWALLPAVQATALGTYLEQKARSARAAGDERTLDQLRADAFTEHLDVKVGVQVLVPASVLMGAGDDPAHLEGFGPIDATAARALAADATWRRILTDPDDGTLVGVSSTTYRPGAVLTRRLVARDQTCRFPTCDRPAVQSDLDHTIPFDGLYGLTTDDNLGPLCLGHHLGKHAPARDHEGPPRLRQPAPGHFVWTMPTGHVYTVGPPELLEWDDPLCADARSGEPSYTELALEQRLRGYLAGLDAAA